MCIILSTERGIYMKNKKNEDTFIDLTPEIYMQITGDKQKEISNLKNNKTKILNEIKEYLRVLKALKEQKKQIKQQIKVNKKKLRASRFKKFKVNRALSITVLIILGVLGGICFIKTKEIFSNVPDWICYPLIFILLYHLTSAIFLPSHTYLIHNILKVLPHQQYQDL